MPNDRYRIAIDVDVGRSPSMPRPSDDTPFRIAICGDFGGRATRPGASSVGRGAWRIDRDDFENVLGRIAPSVHLTLSGGSAVDVAIGDIDDFHPDSLFDRLELFARVRALRKRLASPSTAADAIAELTGKTPAPPPARPVATTSGGAMMSSANLLDQIVDDSGPAPIPTYEPGNELAEFIQRAMAPHLVAELDAGQRDVLARFDAGVAGMMRAILHHPDFQAVEALWRAIWFLVRRVETDGTLQLHLIDVTREELAADLLAEDDPRRTRIYQRLNAIARAEDGGWALVACAYAFGERAADLVVASRFAGLGHALGAPCLAEAHPRLATGGEDADLDAAWEALRRTPQAGSLGLALPRFLLRLPYGAATDAIERFPFEELENLDAHESYLWGSPSIGCASLIANDFTDGGWEMSIGAHRELDDLPLHVVKRDGEAVAKPCAEILMSESDAVALLERGIIPLVSYRDRDVVRVLRLQSVAEPLRQLAGRWVR
jgi:type VI secretion system protein ImpC